MALPNPPGVPPKATPQEFEQKVALARAVIGSLERALRTRRLYAIDHPLFLEATSDLLARFGDFFVKYAYLRLDVTMGELKIESRPVMQCEPREPEIPFRLYKDGVRELKFQRGMTREELLDFLNVLEVDSKRLQEIDEDLVSLAWSKGFKTVQFFAIDEFEGASEERWPTLDAAGLTGVAKEISEGVKETVRVMLTRSGSKAAPGAITTSSGPDTMVLRRVKPASATAPEITEAEIDAFFLAPTEEVSRSVREEVENEGLGGAVRRALDLVLRLVGGRLTAAEVGPLLRGLASYYAAKGDLTGLGHLATRAQERGLFEKLEGGDAIRKQITDDASAPAVRRRLAEHLNAYVGDLEGLKRYFELAGARLVPDGCAAYRRVTNVPARAALKEFLLAHGRESTEGWNDLLAASDKYPLEVFEILRVVKPANLAVDMDAIMRRSDTVLKTLTVTAIAWIETLPRTKLLGRVLADPDPAMRSHALRVIADTKDSGLRPLLQSWIDEPAFPGRPLEEKLLAFRAVAKVGGEAALLWLRQRAEPKSASAKGPDVRRAAVYGVQEVGTLEAYELMKLYRASDDEELRRFAVEATRVK
jgi:hypothetical protein